MGGRVMSRSWRAIGWAKSPNSCGFWGDGGTVRSSVVLRIHRKTARAARLAAPYKTLIELVLLVSGGIFGATFFRRTWGYPSGAASIDVVDRHAIDSKTAQIAAKASFTVGSSSNIDIRQLQSSCKVLGSGAQCIGHCPVIGAAVGGTLPRGDSTSWGCVFDTSIDSCTVLGFTVVGRASGTSGGEAHWHAETVSCPK